ncbi:beta-glucosidase precursor [Gracilibacillus boraciitolerans JCM 21714]|uniref:Beta-glucosidase n=2 Tax=Gracilibacillus boraciitolerans TaxID=307521 RepID=W4VIT1_9BACI|nr:beta-glucosidase precursor [Gracilibacillus boraciitolerans JCM 21714]
MQMPINMKTVEEQYEDVPHDMAPYMDTDEHVYNFGFGLNWSGCIKDKRSSKYMR